MSLRASNTALEITEPPSELTTYMRSAIGRITSYNVCYTKLLRYNELRAFIGNPTGIDGRAIVAAARAKRQASEQVRPKDWVGTVTETQLAFPYLNLWGFPDKFS